MSMFIFRLSALGGTLDENYCSCQSFLLKTEQQQNSNIYFSLQFRKNEEISPFYIDMFAGSNPFHAIAPLPMRLYSLLISWIRDFTVAYSFCFGACMLPCVRPALASAVDRLCGDLQCVSANGIY